MKAVNLIPTDSRRIRSSSPRALATPAFAVIFALAVAVALVTVYVLTSNTVSERQATVASLQQQVVQEQAQVAQLGELRAVRTAGPGPGPTVRVIAQTRFNWHAALADLSKVVPANTSLQSLLGTVAPGSPSPAPAESRAAAPRPPAYAARSPCPRSRCGAAPRPRTTSRD